MYYWSIDSDFLLLGKKSQIRNLQFSTNFAINPGLFWTFQDNIEPDENFRINLINFECKFDQVKMPTRNDSN